MATVKQFRLITSWLVSALLSDLNIIFGNKIVPDFWQIYVIIIPEAIEFILNY